MNRGGYIVLSDIANKAGLEIDIFSPSGKYLYHADIKLPKGLSRAGLFVLAGDHMYILAEDDDGEQILMKFNIKKPSTTENDQ